MQTVYQLCECRSGKKFKFCCKDKNFVYSLRVHHSAFEDFYGVVKIPGTSSLHSLHVAIQAVFRWDDDHMYLFHLRGEEYQSSPLGDADTEIEIKKLDLKVGMKFDYLFDFGDNHEFVIEVLGAEDFKADQFGAKPFQMTRHGIVPNQYGDDDSSDDDDVDFDADESDMSGER